MTIMAIIFVIVFAMAAIDLLGEALGELIAALIAFVLKCLLLTAVLILKLVLRTLIWIAVSLWHGLATTFAFIAFVMMEGLRHSADDHDDDDDDDHHQDQEEDEEEDDHDAYAAALALLGLDGIITEAALRTAYRALMKRVHPDRPGGSTEQAQAANQAYALIRAHHGWT